MAYKVIVADQSYAVKKAVRMALPESDFEIFPFKEGYEILERLSEINPDVVLLSLSLSLKSIHELQKQLKSQGEFQNISLILLKGTFEPLEEEKISGLDYDHIVQAPFDSQRLERIVRDLIEKKNDPRTLPEEPFPDELPDERETDKLEERIRALVKNEISEVERELERRIKDHLIPEMKAWLLEQLEEIKKSFESKE